MSAVARAPAPRAQRGFSFVEILVVMGIIAVLVSLGLVVYNIAFQKTPEIQTRNRLLKFAGKTEAWKLKFGAYPPSDATKIGVVAGVAHSAKPNNLTNPGIEALYLAFLLPGWGQAADATDEELENSDEDALEKPFVPGAALELFEIVDAWGNPLVYFAASDYLTAEKTPPAYDAPGGDAPEPVVYPKPWRSAKTGEFEQKRSFQLFSMGADQTPNTDDDLKAWGE